MRIKNDSVPLEADWNEAEDFLSIQTAGPGSQSIGGHPADLIAWLENCLDVALQHMPKGAEE
jgi:hypothetical protein